jgi:release factor glutamine methyltransferase
MNNSKTLFQDFVSQITIKESTEEIRSIAYMVFENVLNLTMADLIADKPVNASPEIKDQLNEIIRRLNQYEPPQYIFGSAYFYGRAFKVNSNVLIPRPETEELVRTTLALLKNNSSPHVLDVGTGSGCIPVTLALEISNAKVSATDISDHALKVAQQNAEALGANVIFLKHDILNEQLPFSDLDVMISNPPYITLVEKEDMQLNVTGYEPHLALFVPDNDPLLFYKAIAKQARIILKLNGMLITEINERYGKEVANLYLEHGFENVQVLKDISGKDRIVTGALTSR